MLPQHIPLYIEEPAQDEATEQITRESLSFRTDVIEYAFTHSLSRSERALLALIHDRSPRKRDEEEMKKHSDKSKTYREKGLEALAKEEAQNRINKAEGYGNADYGSANGYFCRF